MHATLTIGDYAVCGANGPGAEIALPVQECWRIYTDYVRKAFAESRPVSVLPAQWRLNGAAIETPTAWFVGLKAG